MHTTTERDSRIQHRTIDLTPHIRRMADSGIAQALGLHPIEYAALWPQTIRVPAGVDRKFRRALLVDTRIPLRAIQEAGNVQHLHDQVRPGTGVSICRNPAQRHKRYVLFYRAGLSTLPCLVARKKFKAGVRGLTVLEGLYLAIQEPGLLADYGLNLAGSQISDKFVPYIAKLGFPTVAFGGRSELAESDIFRTPACDPIVVPVA